MKEKTHTLHCAGYPDSPNRESNAAIQGSVPVRFWQDSFWSRTGARKSFGGGGAGEGSSPQSYSRTNLAWN